MDQHKIQTKYMNHKSLKEVLQKKSISTIESLIKIGSSKTLMVELMKQEDNMQLNLYESFLELLYKCLLIILIGQQVIVSEIN